MKKIIYLLALVLIAFGCDNSILEPKYEEPSNLAKFNNPDSDFGKGELKPRKVYIKEKLTCRYTFNPLIQNGKCGGFLGKCQPKYTYENEWERNLRNLNIYVPSVLKIGKKYYRTINLYNLNKYEKLSFKGNVESGKVWGTFKVYLRDIIEEKEMSSSLKADFELSSFIPQPKNYNFGNLLLSGTLSGDINKNASKIKLVGKGFAQLLGKDITATEELVCANDFCWKSTITGNVKSIEFMDE